MTTKIVKEMRRLKNIIPIAFLVPKGDDSFIHIKGYQFNVMVGFANLIALMRESHEYQSDECVESTEYAQKSIEEYFEITKCSRGGSGRFSNSSSGVKRAKKRSLKEICDGDKRMRIITEFFDVESSSSSIPLQRDTISQLDDLDS